MSAASVPFDASTEEKARICRICGTNKDLIRSRFGFSGPELANLAATEDFITADSLIAAVEPREYPDLVLDGVEVGRIALYEMLIQSKRGALNFNSEEVLRYRASLKNVIVVLRVAQRLLSELKPDRLILYNALYSVNRTVCRLAELVGISQYYLHAGDNLSNRLQTLVLSRNHAFSHYQFLREKWEELRNQPCPLDAMSACTNHLLEVAKGRSVWAYSAAPKGSVDLKTFFQIEEGQKVICATMSSDDERFGAEVVGVLPSTDHLLFPKQVDWIRALIAHVENRQDLSLIIRVHPREFPNKREGVLSQHAKMLQDAFSSLPSNVKVNWPTDAVSLYDLACITDAFANAWSSAGREMAWLGLPVVLYSQDLTLYPSDLNYVGVTHSEYLQKLEQALGDGWNPERIRSTYRWSAIDLFYASLDISESFSVSEHDSVLQKTLRRVLRIAAPYRAQRKHARNRAVRLAAAGGIDKVVRDQLNGAVDLEGVRQVVTYDEETVFLKSQIRRIVDGLYGERDKLWVGTLPRKLRDYADS